MVKQRMAGGDPNFQRLVQLAVHAENNKDLKKAYDLGGLREEQSTHASLEREQLQREVMQAYGPTIDYMAHIGKY